MHSRSHENILRFFGILLVAFGVVALADALIYYEPSVVFWMCYTSLFFMGLGILLKNTVLIKSQIYILAIPDLIWSIDFFSFLIRHTSVFGVADYFFLAGPLLPKIVSLQHIIAVPIMFYALLLIKPRKEHSWKLSIIQLIAVYIITRLYTSPELNINCVYTLCGQTPSAWPWYPLVWFAASFLMVVISRAVFYKLHIPIKKRMRIELVP